MTLLPGAKCTKFNSVARAHRMLGPRPASGAPPCPVLERFLHFKDRDAVPATALEADEVKYENVHIRFFQDLSKVVQLDRKKFEAAKLQLHQRGIKYAMLLPARLCLEQNGKVHLFADSEAACAYVKLHIPIPAPTRRKPRGPSNGSSPFPDRGEVAERELNAME